MKHPPSSLPPDNQAGFTLTELLVVIGILTVLSLMLLPTLAGTKGDGRVLQCMNNQKQLTQAWLLYTSDNADALPPNPGWAAGVLDWFGSTDNTNRAILESSGNSAIASYVKAAGLFKCPADTYQSSANPGPRVRSVSLNGVLGSSGPTVQGTSPGGKIYYGNGTGGGARNMMHLVHPGPANVFVLLDEHPDSINDSTFMFDPGYPPGQERFRDLPGSFHNGFGSFSFADGHFELHKWVAPGTVRPVIFLAWSTQGNPIMPGSADYQWMDSKMPYH